MPPRSPWLAALVAASCSWARTVSAEPAGLLPVASEQAPSALEAHVSEQADKADDWAFEAVRYFFGFFYQRGHGLQSQAGPIDTRGSEEMWTVEPVASFRFRTNSRLSHEVIFPVDIVTAASPDALDVVSGASQHNQAFALDVTHTYVADDFDLAFRWGPHFEENFRSFSAGPALTFHFLEDNTVVGLSGYVVADAFDPITSYGRDKGQSSRVALNGNLNVTQVLSQTTLAELSFGVTTQSGQLETTWNSVIVRQDPDAYGNTLTRVPEVFPDNRVRTATQLRLSQHIPVTHTTAKASYRFYADESGVLASTGQVELFQYLAPFLYVRAHGRLHVQNAPKFWTPLLDEAPGVDAPRSSDSDLEALAAREAGLKLVFLREFAPASVRSRDSFDVAYLRYQRSNDLAVDFASLGYARSF